MAISAGMFYAVGVGPGDPELMTIKSVRVLSIVDSIFAPSGEAGIARAIVRSLGLPTGKFRDVPMPMSRDRDGARDAYRRAAGEIARELGEGRSAAWITEGDPLLYGTALHVLDELRAILPGARTEVVPGVFSIAAGAARAGMPIARLGEGVAILPAAYGLERLPASLDQFATVCLLKVHSVFDRLLDRLESIPEPIDSVYLERVGMPGERVVTDLQSLRGHVLPYFSMVFLRRGGVSR